MSKKLIPYLFIALCLSVSFAVSAQQAKKPMTNADVVAMVKGELPETTVILAIQQATANFDTSPDALIQLKKQGVSPKILDAMLQVQAKASNSDASSPGNRTDVKEPDLVSVFFSVNDDGSLKPLERATGNVGYAGTTPVFEIGGNRSPLRLSSNQPQQFVIRLANGVDPGKIDLMRMYLKDGKRGVSLVPSGNFARPAPAKSPTSSGRFQTNISKFGQSSYRLTSQQNLAGGEYCFSTPDETSNDAFCFGIDGDTNGTVDSGPSENSENESGEVVLVDGKRQTQMKYSVTNMDIGGNVFGGTKLRKVLNGSHAKLRITNTSPVFLVEIPRDVNPSDYVVLVQLEIKSDRREVTTSKASAGITGVNSRSGFPKESLIPITIEEMPGNEASAGNKRYQVKTVNPIQTKEYALTILGYRFFDFGIDRTW